MTTLVLRGCGRGLTFRLFGREISLLRSWCWRVGLALPLIGIVLVVLFAQTAVGRWVLLPMVSDRLNAEVTARRVNINRQGDLVLEGLRIGAPEVTGPGGQVLLAERARIDIRWGSLLTGGSPVQEVRLRAPRVRISQDTSRGTVNLAGIRFPKGSGGGSAAGTSNANASDAPAIVIVDGAFEIGEHNATTFRVLDRVNLSGVLSPTTGDDGALVYVFALKQPQGFSSDQNIEIEGRFGSAGVAAKLTGLTLDHWTEERVPTAYQDLLARLNLEGDVASTEFAYAPGGLITATLELRNVGVSLPLEAREDGRSGDIRMRKTSGTISLTGRTLRADLEGLFEDIPYDVELEYDGLSPDAPFSANISVRDYRLSERPRLLPFLPPTVDRRLRQFSSPTALLDADVSISRDGGIDSRVEYGGEIDFRRGKAAFEMFPYEFENLKGRVTFSNERLDIVSIEGGAKSGATVNASGFISPLGPEAALELQINVDDVPIDSAFRQALGPSRSEVLDALFHRDSYRAMVDAGLILTPARAEALKETRDELALRLTDARVRSDHESVDRLAGELADVRSRLKIPELPLGGNVSLRLELRRLEGLESIWKSHYYVTVPDAGLAIREFPLPARIAGLSLDITDNSVDILEGRIEPLTGGAAEFKGGAALRAPDGRGVFWPSISGTVEGITVDRAFVHALRAGGAGDDSATLIERLGASGKTGGVVKLVTRRIDENRGDFGVEIVASLDDATFAASELEEVPGVLASQIRGSVTVSERTVGVRADIGSVEAIDEQARPTGPKSSMTLDATVNLGKDERSGIQVNAGSPRFDVRVPVEQLALPFSEQTSRLIAKIRAEHDPAGSGDMAFELSQSGVEQATDLRWSLFSDRMDGASAFWLGDRFDFSGPVLSLRVAGGDENDPVSVTVQPSEGTLAFGPRVLGALRVDPGEGNDGVQLSLVGGVLEHDAVTRFVGEVAPSQGKANFDALAPRGLFDASVWLPSAALSGREPLADVRAELRPKSLMLSRRGQDVTFDEVNGIVRIQRGRASLDSVSLIGPELSAFLGGSWAFGQGGGLRAEISAEAPGLTPASLAFLPQSVVDTIEGMAVATDETLTLRDATLVLDEDGGSAFVGRVLFEDASGKAGIEVSQANGWADIESVTGSPGNESENAFAIDLRLSDAMVSGVAVQEASLLAESDGADRVVLSGIKADSHGGRIEGNGELKLGEDMVEYSVAVRGAGLNLAGVQTDIARKKDPEADAIRNRGAMLDGELTLSGRTDDPMSTAGRGTLRATGGRVLDVPFTVLLTQAVNLAAPIGDSLNAGRAAFLVSGDRITFSELSVLSDSVGIFGYGTMSWPEQQLDLRFRSQSARRIPVVSPVVEAVRDEFVTVRMTGPASKPSVGVEQFSSTRRILEDIFGSGASEEKRRLHELWLRSERGRDDAARSVARRQPNLLPQRAAEPEPETGEEPDAEPRARADQ